MCLLCGCVVCVWVCLIVFVFCVLCVFAFTYLTFAVALLFDVLFVFVLCMRVRWLLLLYCLMCCS